MAQVILSIGLHPTLGASAMSRYDHGSGGFDIAGKYHRRSQRLKNRKQLEPGFQTQGQFRERPLPAGLPLVKAIAVADANSDGVLDLLAVHARCFQERVER